MWVQDVKWGHMMQGIMLGSYDELDELSFHFSNLWTEKFCIGNATSNVTADTIDISINIERVLCK
jgi:hypothetical protein